LEKVTQLPVQNGHIAITSLSGWSIHYWKSKVKCLRDEYSIDFSHQSLPQELNRQHEAIINQYLTTSLSSDKLNSMKNNTIVGLKELRENIEAYISRVKAGDSFIVVKKSKPVFRISSPDDDASLWEPVVDFTKLKKGGIPITDLLTRL
jgi:prevent-host-death family protein